MIRYYLANKDWDLYRATEGSSGYDLKADIGELNERIINPGERWFVPTGLYLEMPIGVEGQVRSRSGLARNAGVIVLNAPGTVDADYRGEVIVTLFNSSDKPWTMIRGERIAQIVFAPTVQFFKSENYFGFVRGGFWEPQRVPDKSLLNDTARGAGGHGSTGR